jgi:hypothetical protein
MILCRSILLFWKKNALLRTTNKTKASFSKSLFNCPFYGVKRHEKINFPLMLFFYFKFE